MFNDMRHAATGPPFWLVFSPRSGYQTIVESLCSRVLRSGLFSFLAIVAAGSALTVGRSAPLNDNFANAILVTGSTNSLTGSNIGATAEAGESAHAGNPATNSVWWSWTAPFTGSVLVSTFGSSFDTELGIYTGSSVPNLSLVASDDDSGYTNSSKVIFHAYAGEAYRIAVDGFQGATGIIHLAIRPAGVPAPAWEFTDVYGNPLRSADLTNKVLLIDFWETICTGCIDELPHLIRLQDKFKDAGFQLIGLYANSGTQEDVRNFMQENGINYRIAESTPQIEADLGGLLGYPTKYLVDRDFKVVAQIGFTGNLAYYEKLIGPLLRSPMAVRLQAIWDAGTLRLTWPGVESGYVVEATDNLSSTNWATVQAISGQSSLSLSPEAGGRFYRLRKQ